jgi:multiple sugar transport system substrate-binding protein
MAPLRISIADHIEEATDSIKALLLEYEETHRTDIEVTAISWKDMWLALKQVAITKSEMDVSEIGSTWLSSLVSMNALRPISTHELAEVGGRDTFLPAAWESASPHNDSRVWSIPWLADARVIYYWRDMLEDAGIDEAAAFQTPEQMEATLARLTASGAPAAWAAPTQPVSDMLHYLASWLWNSGQDFVSADGTQTAFAHPDALEAIVSYFRLHRYMPQDGVLLTEPQAFHLFETRQAAVCMSGSWNLMVLAEPDTRARLGLALPPGPPFVGGSNLVIWQHIAHHDVKNAIDLVRFLLTAEVQREVCGVRGLLPVRQDMLAALPYSRDQHYQVFTRALREGRPLPAISLWGTVEQNLVTTLGSIWQQIRTQPGQPIEDIITAPLEALARRLDRTLSQA